MLCESARHALEGILHVSYKCPFLWQKVNYKTLKTETAIRILVIYYSFTVMSPSNTTYRALVFGASGITGWAVVQEALQYPSPATFDKVIGLTNRHLTKSDALLPEDERLELHSGVDLRSGASQVEAILRKIDGIEGVTHVYFSGKC